MNTWKMFQKKQALIARGVIILVQGVVVTALLAGCSGSGGGSGSAATADPSGTPPQGVGGIQVAGRLSGSDLPDNGTPWPAATPDNVTLDIEEVAVSTDGTQFTPVLQGPIQFDLSSADGTAFPGLDQLPAGEYVGLRLKISSITWHATWTVTNPSPCDESNTGQAQGTVNLGGNAFFYFMTPEMGGNTLRHYQTKLPINSPNYVGDTNNPFLLTAPLLISKDNVSTLDLVLGTSGTLTCSTITTRDNLGTPGLKLGGSTTLLKGISALSFDPDHDEVAVVNTTGNSITVYRRNTLTTSSDGDVSPVRTIAGPNTRLTLPRGIALYRDTSDPSNDEMIVANSGNNTITVYGIAADGNVAPTRTITGIKSTDLDVPVGVAVRRGSSFNEDEIWVANNGNDTVTVYPRINYGDATPLYTLGGQNTGLSAVCAITYDTVNDQVLVANNILPNSTLGNDRITAYNRSEIKANGNSANINPAFIIGGDQTGINKPCGIAVDNTADEVYVGNTGNNTITVYDRAAVIASTDGNVAPLRTFASQTPQGLHWDTTHQELWVAERGAQPAMTTLPLISPVSSDADAASSPLQGRYNIVSYGVDIGKGVNGLGYTIPVLFSERGTATFNPTAGNAWSSMVVNINSSLARQLMEPTCPPQASKTINGIYDVDSQGGLHAFMLDQDGSLTGAVHPSGDFFAAAAYDSTRRMYIMLGVKDTGTATPQLTPSGLSSAFSYAGYSSQITLKRFDPTNPKNDFLVDLTQIGAARLDPNHLVGLAVDWNLQNVIDPMGDFAAPTSGTAVYIQHGDTVNSPIPLTPHPGGQVEVQSATLGLVGAATADGNTAIFMSDTGSARVDTNSCPTTLGYSIALRSSPELTDQDIKGSYYIAAFGDKGFQKSDPERSTYRIASGTLTFDGEGGGRLSLAKSDEGDVLTEDDTITYKIRNDVKLPYASAATTAAFTIVDLYKAPDDVNPIASAVVGAGGQNMIFYDELYETQETADKTLIVAKNGRLVGFAVHRGQ